MADRIFQTLTVEYTVTGSLDGVTPAPELAAPKSTGDVNQKYTAEAVNLGLIDPDFTPTGPATGIAHRLVSPLYIKGPGVFAAGAEVSVVDAPLDGVITQQERVVDLAGAPPFYLKSGIYLPQASSLRVSGLTATPDEPIIVRASFFILGSPEQVAEALAAICCFESSALRTVIGAMSVDNTPTSIATIVGALGAFVRVGTGNAATHPLFLLDLADSDVSLQPVVAPTAPTQELRYDGDEPIAATVGIAVSVINGTVLGVAFRARLILNGVPVPGATMSGATAVVSLAGQLAFSVDVNLVPGDTLALEIANFTNATPLIVQFARLVVVKTLR